MTIANDFIFTANQEIRYVGPEGRSYTALELHRYLQDLADRISSDDLGPFIYDGNPSIRYTDNMIELTGGWHLSEQTARHLRSGSIIVNGGQEVWVSQDSIDPMNIVCICDDPSVSPNETCHFCKKTPCNST